MAIKLWLYNKLMAIFQIILWKFKIGKNVYFYCLRFSHGHLSYYLSYTQSYDMLKYCRTKSVFYTGSHAVSQKPIKRD